MILIVMLASVWRFLSGALVGSDVHVPLHIGAMLPLLLPLWGLVRDRYISGAIHNRNHCAPRLVAFRTSQVTMYNKGT